MQHLPNYRVTTALFEVFYSRFYVKIEKKVTFSLQHPSNNYKDWPYSWVIHTLKSQTGIIKYRF